MKRLKILYRGEDMDYRQNLLRDEKLAKESDSRIWARIRKKYGANWTLEDIEGDDPLFAEFWYRVAKGG